MSGSINIGEIANRLLAEMDKAKVQIDGQKEGVVLFYEEIRRAFESSNQSGGEAEAEKQSDPTGKEAPTDTVG